MPTYDSVFKESDGKSVTVTTTTAVVVDAVCYIQSWLGITQAAAGAGEAVALLIDRQEMQFKVPAALAVAKGAVVYIDTAQITAHYPVDAAYSTSAGTGKIALFKATQAKDSNNVVTGILLPFGQQVF